MQIKNYTLSAEEIIDLVHTDPSKAENIIRDLITEYNSMPCGITWKVSDKVKETKFQKNNGEVCDIQNSFAYIKHRRDLDINPEKILPYNTFVIGDNYHVLEIMQDKFQNELAFVYCDVPYNTGNDKDFMYNDNMVDASDPWRDSKWLNFINRRFK